MPRLEFDVELVEALGGGVGFYFPYNVGELFGGKSRVKVACTFDGYPYRGSLVPMGGRHVIGVLKEIRKEIGKEVGDTIHVIMEEDITPRLVEIPEDFALALEINPPAKEIFEKQSYTVRKEHILYITSSKKTETRLSHIQKVIELLLEINNKRK